MCAALAPGLAAAQSDTDTGAGAAVTLDQVEEAWHSDDFETARAGLLTFAEDGMALAQYRLGYMMANASGGPFDREGAIKWLEKAVAQGHQPAFLLLARVYMSNRPELDDYVRAAELLEQAVAQDSAEAHFYLAQLLRIGRGVEPDPARAYDLMGKAARAGVLDAKFALSQMYSRGEGT
jgi:TPR repeat protein